MFTEVFPQITLAFDYEARRLSASKGGKVYGPSSLSDGEKQVFSILADLIELEEKHKVIIVDEPELNLNPELAERLWTLLENEFPEKTFIYATHSISFALRENVNVVYVLSSDSENISLFTGLDTLPRAEVTAFLGGLPGIISANRVIVTEGHEKSFDAIFYRWLLGDDRVEIYPAGSCGDVINVVTKAGLWKKISSHVELRGVVDSDYQDEGYLSSILVPSVIVLPLHEAESYLCLPDVLSAIGDRIGSQENALRPDEIWEFICDSLKARPIAIAARRVLAHAKIHLAIGVERRVLASAQTRDDLIAHLKKSSESELQKARTLIGPAQIESAVDNELASIDAAVESHETTRVLRLLPAKELLNSLAPRAGCKNATDLMRSLKKNFAPADFPMTSELKRLLNYPVWSSASSVTSGA